RAAAGARRSRDEPAVTAGRDIFRIPATVLFILGIVDLIRGIMHTFLLRWAGVHIAGFNPVTTPSDQFFMLGAFGISNLLTGFLYLLISRKARTLSPYVLAIIPATYLLGMIGIGVAKVNPQAVFDGKYFMTVYLALCVATVAVFLVQRGAQRKNL
ncbi:MAG: hypothetical protein ACR2JI_06070, partial [Mycobacterium sp.]